MVTKPVGSMPCPLLASATILFSTKRLLKMIPYWLLLAGVASACSRKFLADVGRNSAPINNPVGVPVRAMAYSLLAFVTARFSAEVDLLVILYESIRLPRSY